MLGIVILNYNNWKMSIDCLNSLLSKKMFNYNIYLVDNNSSERIPNEFKKLLKNNRNINFIQNDKNAGYSAGNNIGIYKAIEDKCDAILIANNDILFHDFDLQNFYEKKYDEEVAIIGPNIYLPNNQFQEINMGVEPNLLTKYKLLLSKLSYRILFNKVYKDFYLIDYQRVEMKKVYSVSGCCFLVKESVFEVVFPLDEDIFLYFEEHIIGSKLKNTGYKCIIDPNFEVLHNHSQTTKKMKIFSYAHLVRSERIVLKKYYGANWFALLPLLVFRILILTLKVLKSPTKMLVNIKLFRGVLKNGR